MRHLDIGQRQKAPNFSAFHWSPHGCLITIGQHFVTTRVVHLPKRTETSLITESDQSRANHQLSQLCTDRTAWFDSDQAVGAVHSCKSWFRIASWPSTGIICLVLLLIYFAGVLFILSLLVSPLIFFPCLLWFYSNQAPFVVTYFPSHC